MAYMKRSAHACVSGFSTCVSSFFLLLLFLLSGLLHDSLLLESSPMSLDELASSLELLNLLVLDIVFLLHDVCNLISLSFFFNSHVVLLLDLVQILKGVIVFSLSLVVIKSLVTNISVVNLDRGQVIVSTGLEVLSLLVFLSIIFFGDLLDVLHELVSHLGKLLNLFLVGFFDHLFLFESCSLSISNGNLSVVLFQTLLLLENFEGLLSLLLGLGTFFTVFVKGILFGLLNFLELLDSLSHDFQVIGNLEDFFKWCAKFLLVKLSNFFKRLSETLKL